MLKPRGRVSVGSVVEAEREANDGEWERCQVKSLDGKTGLLSLLFDGGFVRDEVAVSSVNLVDKPVDVSDGGGYAGGGGEGEATLSDAAYAEEVGPLLPTPPTTASLQEDEEAKYAFIRAYKDVGNALFKAGKFAWAIRTYTAAVDALAASCYASREYMLWDYFARGPCGQCYSNAALCALKLGDHAQAAALCDRAMACKPEDADLVKVLLRHGQALLGLGCGAEAKQVLDRAAEKDPANRAVREELVRAKKAAAAADKEANKRLFQSVDLSKHGLTSKREEDAKQLKEAVDAGFHALVSERAQPHMRACASLLPSCDATRLQWTRHR